MDEVEGPRSLPAVVYPKRFLLWWGLTLFLCKLGSRRQLDYQLNPDGPEPLANLNRLAGAAGASRPVNKTLEYFLGKLGSEPVAGLRPKALNRLIRSKALDPARLAGRFVVLVDGSGYLLFRYRHCDHCSTRRHGDTVLCMHQVLEAKLVGPGGTVFSIATRSGCWRACATGAGRRRPSTWLRRGRSRSGWTAVSPDSSWPPNDLPSSPELAESGSLGKIRPGYE
jgi:hypothetical protein